MPGFATREDCDAGLADLKAGFSAAYKHSVCRTCLSRAMCAVRTPRRKKVMRPKFWCGSIEPQSSTSFRPDTQAFIIPCKPCEAECVVYLIAVTNAVVTRFSILRASSHTCRKSGLRFTFDCTNGRLVFSSGALEF